MGRRDGAKVTHELRRGRFGNISALSESLCRGNAVIALIRRRQSWIFIGIFLSVKIAAATIAPPTLWHGRPYILLWEE